MARECSRRLFGKVIVAVLMSVLVLGNPGHSMAAGSSEEEENAEVGPFYWEMEPLSIPVRSKRSGRTKYYMFMTLSMEFAERSQKEYSERLAPRIRDAFLMEMNGTGAVHDDPANGVNLALVKSRLKKQAEKVLGGNAPTDILVVRVIKGS
ncbi:hypothetical protein [Sneathiella chinensis]|uniref:Flagellar protein FliL n=1 Tax=Sneathiella chinensis TaxID=349750 RepID=A0ABQ5U7N5_9PROT|nr:hypothetical protein [Sneathiella chinensis]GLQ06476.1 hypothetical protein GCM10007924_16970 [Sneathiella chinensis]